MPFLCCLLKQWFAQKVKLAIIYHVITNPYDLLTSVENKWRILRNVHAALSDWQVLKTHKMIMCYESSP